MCVLSCDNVWFVMEVRYVCVWGEGMMLYDFIEDMCT